MKILILGYGRIGHAMEYLLKENHELMIYDKFPQPGFKNADLAESAKAADYVMFCLQVSIHRELAEEIRPLLKPEAVVLSIAKGLDEEGLSAAQIFEKYLPEHKRTLLYGPMIAEDICKGGYGFAQAGCPVDVYPGVRDLYKNSNLFIEHTTDITGISWSVILKNVYAILFGVTDELKMGINMRGYLASAALKELNDIVQAMGGNSNAPYFLAGLSDLIATGTSENSHHHTLGRQIARGETGNLEGEGLHTLKMVNKFKLFDTAKYPLFTLIDEIANRPENPARQIDAYLKRLFHKS